MEDPNYFDTLDGDVLKAVYHHINEISTIQKRCATTQTPHHEFPLSKSNNKRKIEPQVRLFYKELKRQTAKTTTNLTNKKIVVLANGHLKMAGNSL